MEQPTGILFDFTDGIESFEYLPNSDTHISQLISEVKKINDRVKKNIEQTDSISSTLSSTLNISNTSQCEVQHDTSQTITSNDTQEPLIDSIKLDSKKIDSLSTNQTVSSIPNITTSSMPTVSSMPILYGSQLPNFGCIRKRVEVNKDETFAGFVELNMNTMNKFNELKKNNEDFCESIMNKFNQLMDKFTVMEQDLNKVKDVEVVKDIKDVKTNSFNLYMIENYKARSLKSISEQLEHQLTIKKRQLDLDKFKQTDTVQEYKLKIAELQLHIDELSRKNQILRKKKVANVSLKNELASVTKTLIKKEKLIKLLNMEIQQSRKSASLIKEETSTHTQKQHPKSQAIDDCIKYHICYKALKASINNQERYLLQVAKTEHQVIYEQVLNELLLSVPIDNSTIVNNISSTTTNVCIVCHKPNTIKSQPYCSIACLKIALNIDQQFIDNCPLIPLTPIVSYANKEIKPLYLNSDSDDIFKCAQIYWKVMKDNKKQSYFDIYEKEKIVASYKKSCNELL
jgi:hypothetical protein